MMNQTNASNQIDYQCPKKVRVGIVRTKNEAQAIAHLDRFLQHHNDLIELHQLPLISHPSPTVIDWDTNLDFLLVKLRGTTGEEYSTSWKMIQDYLTRHAALRPHAPLRMLCPWDAIHRFYSRTMMYHAIAHCIQRMCTERCENTEGSIYTLQSPLFGTIPTHTPPASWDLPADQAFPVILKSDCACGVHDAHLMRYVCTATELRTRVGPESTTSGGESAEKSTEQSIWQSFVPHDAVLKCYVASDQYFHIVPRRAIPPPDEHFRNFDSQAKCWKAAPPAKVHIPERMMSHLYAFSRYVADEFCTSAFGFDVLLSASEERENSCEVRLTVVDVNFLPSYSGVENPQEAWRALMNHVICCRSSD